LRRAVLNNPEGLPGQTRRIGSPAILHSDVHDYEFGP
jgi:hypothetical protein